MWSRDKVWSLMPHPISDSHNKYPLLMCQWHLSHDKSYQAFHYFNSKWKAWNYNLIPGHIYTVQDTYKLRTILYSTSITYLTKVLLLCLQKWSCKVMMSILYYIIIYYALLYYMKLGCCSLVYEGNEIWPVLLFCCLLHFITGLTLSRIDN